MESEPDVHRPICPEIGFPLLGNACRSAGHVDRSSAGNRCGARKDGEEQERIKDILWNILPVSQRAAGLFNDAKLAGNPAPMALAGIKAPTLAISLEDDRFLTVDAARHIAASVPGACLIIYPTGGHIWIGHDGELFGAIEEFLGDIGYR